MSYYSAVSDVMRKADRQGVSRPRWWPTRWGPDLTAIFLLAVVSFGFSLHIALIAPPLYSADERSHAGYAISLLHGHLPTIDTPVVDDPENYPQIAESLDTQYGERRDIWTANHPPLYYLVSVPFLAAADAVDAPGAGLLAMRLINALGSAISVFLVGLLARELIPWRPAASTLAAGLAASCATMAYLGGFIYNDGLATAASSLTLLLGVRMLRHGPTRGMLIAAAATGAVASSLRVAGIVAVFICTLLAAASVVIHERGADRNRKAVRAAVFVGGLPALAIGWFYLRNIVLYGDFGASQALLEKFEREPGGSFLQIASDLGMWVRQLDGMWVRGTPDGLAMAWLPQLLAALAAVGLILAAVRWRRRRREQRELLAALAPVTTEPEPKQRPVVVYAWIAVIAHAILVEISFVDFVTGGGNPHVRYALPLVPLVATVMAGGLLALTSTIPSRWPDQRDAMVALAITTFMLVFGSVALTVSDQIISSDDKAPGLEAATIGGIAPALGFVLAGVAALAYVVNRLRAAGGWALIRHPEPVPVATAGESAQP